jgi:hypothetical protein
MQNIKIFNVKWTFKDKNLQHSRHLKIKKIKKYILEKFQCNPLINFSFDDVSFKICFSTLL